MTRLLLSACLLTLAACGQASAPTGPATVAVSDALCRPTPNGRDVTGCYLTLTASQADRLVSVGSPVAGLAQIHEMKTENGMMMMGELKDGLALPAGEAVSLAPGGNHIMLLQLKQPLAAGEQVPLTLTFEHAQPVGVRAAVGQPPAAS
ncbi:copper chaperone PCu(A)C [Brevundimonas subvibrioides]|uniref:copper chaperone PCu(A)C n=1 Tax=Brevundimonas subvibrioides TaxID=74313 RepID=UPI0032D5ABC0